MARFSKGRRALAISDRSGAAFPYREMVKEWTGAFVHNSEFEAKQPQLEPHPVGADPQGLLGKKSGVGNSVLAGLACNKACGSAPTGCGSNWGCLASNSDV